MSGLRIVALSAGVSTPSSTRLLADRVGAAAVDALALHGRAARLETIELRIIAGDVTNMMLTGIPSEALRAAIESVRGADALVAVSPIYTSSYSGLFKSFLDVLDVDALAGMPVVLGATGGTARHSLAIEYAMRPVFAYLKAAPVATAVFAATDDWGSNGGENSLGERITRAGEELAAALGSREPRQHASGGLEVPEGFAGLLRTADGRR